MTTRGGALFIVAVLGLGGCATPAGDFPGNDATLAAASALALSLSDGRLTDINFFAREAVEEAGDIQLIAIEERPAASLVDPFGSLSFMIPIPGTVAYPDADVPTVACYRMEFNYYGALAVNGASRGDGITEFACPANAAPVTPPPDRSEHRMLAKNAEEVVIDVLASTDQQLVPDPAVVVAAILQDLEPPIGEYEVLAQPWVLVEGRDIGVAIDAEDGCLLVSRIAGVVARVYVAPVKLKPGELGCLPGTALMDPTLLLSPH